MAYTQNVPGAVAYISPSSDMANVIMLKSIEDRSRQYEQQLNTIAENQALLSQMKFRDPDRANALLGIAQTASDLQKTVDETYAGDYASAGAKKLIANRIASERGKYAVLQQKYEEEQPYKQLYANLAATGELAGKYNPLTGKTEVVNPFSQAMINENGELINTHIDYTDIKKKQDYVGFIDRNLMPAINERVRDKGVKYAQGPYGYTKLMVQGRVIGSTPEEASASITDADAETFLKENPTFAFEYGNDINTAKQYIQNVVYNKAKIKDDVNRNIISDPLASAKFRMSLTKPDPNAPGIFGAQQRESGQDNPFIAKREKFSKIYNDALSSIPAQSRGDFNTVRKALVNKLETAKKNYSQYDPKNWGSRQMTTGDLAAKANYALEAKNTLALLERFDGMHKEASARKTNWFNDAARNITGDPNATYKTLPDNLKREIRTNAPKSDAQWASMFDADREGRYITYRNLRPLHPDAQKVVGQQMGNFDGATFRVAGQKIGSSNVYDLAKKMDVSPQAIMAGIKSGELTVKYVEATGEYSVAIPKGLKISDSGKLSYKSADDKDADHVYFSIDNATNKFQQILSWAESKRWDAGKSSNNFDLPAGVLKINKNLGSDNFTIEYGGQKQNVSKDMLENIIMIEQEKYLQNKYQPLAAKSLSEYNKYLQALEKE